MNQPTRGRNYGVAELKQVCFSMLAVSQDPVVGNGQRSEKFWERVHVHYHNNKPQGAEARGKKSIEGKWGDIKHDVAKFYGVYQQVEGLQISGTNNEDTLLKAHELYKQNHPKKRTFAYEPCFWILKNVPRWGDRQDEMVTSNRRTSSGVIENQTSNGSPPCQEGDHSETVQPSSDEAQELDVPVERKCPGGNKRAKEDLKRQKFDQEALKASIKATENLEKSNAERNYCTQINTMMRLIMMPTASLNPGMRAFAEEFQLEEARILRTKIREATSGTAHTTQYQEPEHARSPDPTSPLNAATSGEYYMPEGIHEDLTANHVGIDP